MGCCQTKSDAPNPSATGKKSGAAATTTSSNTSSKPSSGAAGGAASPGSDVLRETQVQLAFKAKRANVFTQSVETEDRRSFIPPSISKTAKQESTIRSALKENYVFNSLDERDIKVLVNAMTIVQKSQGDNVVEQGQAGDYFYIIESGNFTVIIDKKPVGQIGSGKSFGEFALIYDVPRQATIRADTPSTLFALDRQTFKFILANNTEDKATGLSQAIDRVPLLQGLTAAQREKLADSVVLVDYSPGETIIKKGGEGSLFYMIKEGVCTVDDVGEKFKAHKLSAGDYFGERALMTSEPRAATITADTKVTVMALDKTDFQNLLGPLQELLDYNLNMRVLGSIKLFEKLTKEEKNKLCKSFESETFTAGTTIIREGDKGRKFYVLVEGKTSVLKDDTPIAELKSGDYFGEMALLDDEVRKASIIALTDCKCFNIDRPTFNKILGSLHHVMARETMNRLEAIRESTASAESAAQSAVQLNLRLEDLSHLAVLGSGTFGRVTLVQDKASKNVYALKAMLKSEIVACKQQANVMNEKNVMIQCDHPFILRLYQTFKDPKKLYMLLEFVQGGELFSVLHKPDRDGVPDHHAKFYAAGVVLALAYLHNKDVAYRDMKPENCLVDREGYPKLVDFGFAKVITGKSFTLCGTPEYLAPELVLGRGHNKAVDYWAFGILVYEMQAGRSPFSDPSGNMDQVVICKNIVNGQLKFERNFNVDCKEMCKKLLSREIQNRLGNLKGGPDEIKQSRWFQGLDFDQYTKKMIRAPWIPPVKSVTDTSQFDPYGADDHQDDGYIDNGTWDKDF